MMAAQLVVDVRDKLMTTASLHLVLPYRDVQGGFNQLQKERFDRIVNSAADVICLHENNTPDCPRALWRLLADRCDYVVGVTNGRTARGEVRNTLNMARRKGKKAVL